MKIGIKNFRVFKDIETFELRPITILLGPNNAGKSSLTKLLLLLKNGIERLDFSKGDHNLESFDKILNLDSESQEIRLNLDFAQDILPGGYLTINYKNSIKPSIKIGIPGQSALITYSYSFGQEEGFGYEETYCERKIDLFQIMDLVYDKKVPAINTILQDQLDINIIEQYLNLISRKFGIKINTEDVLFSNLDDVFKMIFNALEEESKYRSFRGPLRNLAFKNELERMKRDYMPYKVLLEGEDITDRCEQIILDTYNIWREGNKYGMAEGPWISQHNTFMDRLDSMLRLEIDTKVWNKPEFQVKTEKDISIEHTPIGKILFQRLLGGNRAEYLMSPSPSDAPDIPGPDSSTIEFSYSLIEKLKLHPEPTYNFNKIEYISANRGSQKRGLLNRGESQMDEIIKEYSARRHKDFQKKALELFNIRGELVVKRFENFASAVYLKDDKGEMSLADMGYGYSQIIPIIIGIINKIKYYPMGRGVLNLVRKELNRGTTFIIEEPEANLHPNLQSKFADFLQLAIEEFAELKFVVETHSEYLIRKLQYLVAKKSLAPEDVIIYYFNDDKYVSDKEPKVKEIEITNTGNLTDTFGPGFYDEATQLKFDLMQINKEQKN